MHTYKAVQGAKDGAFDLVKDGQVSSCPKTAVLVPQQNTMTQQVSMAPVKFPCSTNCPFATVEKRNVHHEKGDDNLDDVYVVGCASVEKVFELTEVKKHSALSIK